ncbi:hypothetical protein AAFC00_006137 [Neodothiora populina]|uniref:DUF7165 domain-containing protein n=1 Tax=Neodothiora populina TaxID=2781224 RepID=A0ABR3P472_9PEZI
MARHHDDTYAHINADQGHENAYDNHEAHVYTNKQSSDREGDASATDESYGYSTDDDTSDIGRAVTTSTYQPATPSRVSTSTSNARYTSPSPRPHFRNGSRESRVAGFHPRSRSNLGSDPPTTPPSRRGSLRASRTSTPTTFVPSKQDRLRYSWQSLVDEDESSKPRIHVIKIVSTASTASAGIGQEEAFGFSISGGGKRIAVYNSARIFILQTAALPVNVSQEYALKRKPLAVEVVDEENVLAVLADEHTINIYHLSHSDVRRSRTIRPDHPTYTIALSKTGALLAAAYEGGVEIFSLAQSALSTDRRAIRSPRMDKLLFSDDSSTLLGTTTRLHASSTVVVSVPVFPANPDGVPSHDELKNAWCGGLLNPENIRNSSHATFWREGTHMSNEDIFAWDGSEDTFGIMHLPSLEYGNVACPLGVSQPLSVVGGLGAAVHSTPAVDESGCSVAMIVNHTTVRIYTIPQEPVEGDVRVEAHSLDHELNDEYGCPFADVRWVHSHKSIAPPADCDVRTRGRLIVASPGSMCDPEMAQQTVQDIEGGRIIIFDFDPQYAGQPGQLFTFTLGKAPPLKLDEEDLDVATEVDLVRRRTISRNRNGTLGEKPPSLGRTATTRRKNELSRMHNSSPMFEPSTSMQNTPIQEHAPIHLFSHLRGSHHPSSSLASLIPEATRSLPDLLEASELAYEQPYTQGAPRSGGAIQRAATNANRHRFQTLEEQRVEHINPDGLTLPAYSEIANQPLPAKFRKLAGLDIPSTGRYIHTSGIATAPPTIQEARDGYPFPTTAARPANLSPILQSTPRASDSDVSSSVSRTTASSHEGWDSDSPVSSRTPTMPILSHQPSWETVTTQQRDPFYPSSEQSFSPISRTATQASVGSPTSPGLQSPPMLPLPSAQQSLPEPSSSVSHEVPSAASVPNHLGISFRHSLLLPLDQYPLSSEDRPPSAASTSAAHSPIHGQVNMNANGNSNSYYRALTQRQTPFQRVNGLATGVGGISAPRSSLASGNTSNGVSSGSVPHPVTGWYAPAPRSPAVSSVHGSNSSMNGSDRPSISVTPSPIDPGTPTFQTGINAVRDPPRPDFATRAASAPLTRYLATNSPSDNSGTKTTIISTANKGTNPHDSSASISTDPSKGKPTAFLNRNGTVTQSLAVPNIAVQRSKSVGGVGGIYNNISGKRRTLRGAGPGESSPNSLSASGEGTPTRGSSLQMRDEFKELETQGKKCVVM